MPLKTAPQTIQGYYIAFVKSPDEKTLTVRLRKTNKMGAGIWKDFGLRPEVTKEDMNRRKKQILSDTNGNYKTKFKSIVID